MKTSIKHIATAVAGALLLTACINDLDTLPLNPSDSTSETVYGKDEAGYIAGLTKLYFNFVSNETTDLQVSDGGASELVRAYWTVEEVTADACKCAGDRGGQQVPLLIGEDGKTDFGAEALHDADDQRAADAPLVAHGEFERGREGFREQCGSRLAHDDGGQRACEQPESVKQAFEAWSHRLEEGQRRGADDVPAPEDHAGCDGNDRGHDDVDHTPFDVGFANCGRLVFFSHKGMCLSLMQRHGK